MAGLLFQWAGLARLGAGLYVAVVLFYLVTLPVEFNASARALRALKASNRFSEDELKGVKKVLTAAALTYVAALAVSLTQLLRFLILINGRKR